MPLGDIITLYRGDITTQVVDAIVNAANNSLLGGGGVDGAIHKVAGPRLLEQCNRLGGCDTGDAKYTEGGNLRASYVIHTVGPVYRSRPQDAEKLASCYRRCLAIAAKLELSSIAFPSISTGAYRYPITAASRIALGTVADELKHYPNFKELRFVLFSETDLEIYRDSLHRISDKERK